MGIYIYFIYICTYFIKVKQIYVNFKQNFETFHKVVQSKQKNAIARVESSLPLSPHFMVEFEHNFKIGK